ncbi:hypothetical protein C0991_000413, partial [Blastosporella zonata]
MPSTRKSSKPSTDATSVAGSAVEPTSSPIRSTSSRQHTLTKKQQQNFNLAAAKAATAKKKQDMADICHEQMLEEHCGFTNLTISSNTHLNNEDSDGYETEEAVFASETVLPPPIKITTQNGKTLVHRVPPPSSTKENANPLQSEQ